MQTYFVLQPGHWRGVAEHLCRPLVGSRQGHTPNIPWVSVARSTGYGQFSLVRRDGLAGPEARSLVAAAQEWIAQNELTWQVVAERGLLFWKRPDMLRPINAKSAMGLTANPMDDLSSEQILSPRALAAAAEKLGAPELIAVVPKRGWLVLSACRVGELPRMMAAHQVAAGVFGRAGDEALSDTAFFLQGGELVGTSVMGPSGGSLSLVKADENEWQFPR